MSVGPNHKDGCTGETWRFSGEGYNRVKLCACGAEDHAPDSPSGMCMRADWMHKGFHARYTTCDRWEASRG